MYATLSGSGIVTDPGTGVPVIPNDQVIWLPGSSNYLMRSGTLAPGLSQGERLTSLFSTSLLNRMPRINTHGQVAFAANFSDAAGVALGTGVWTNRTGSFMPVVKTGDIAPGFPAGSVISAPLIGNNSYIFADDGSVVFTSYVTNSQNPTASQLAIFKNSANGGTQLIYSSNQQAPGAAAGVLISDSVAIANLRLNSNGEIAFAAELTGPGVDATNKMGVFRFANEALQMVARQGDLIPDSGGWRIRGIVSEPLMYFNNSGQLLFAVSATDGPTGYGSASAWLRIDANGNLKALAISNEIVPGQVGARVSFGSLSLNALMSFNDAGEIVLQNSLFPGGDLSGDAIVVIKIVDGPSTNQCAADLNSDGSTTVQDIFSFLTLWSALDTHADFNGDGGITVQDLFEFLNVWFEGCS